jgi:hypothetical protein
MKKVKLILIIIIINEILQLGKQTHSLIEFESKPQPRTPLPPFVYKLNKRLKRDVSDEYSNYFKNRTKYNAIEDVFNNQTFKINTAAHGLNFVSVGRSFIVNDYWIQFIKIDSPFFAKPNLNTLDFKEICESYVNKSFNAKSIQFDTFCVNSNNLLEESLKEMNNILQNKYNEFIKKNNRKKRFIVAALAITGLAAVGLTGFYLGKNSNDVEIKIKHLEEEMSKNNLKFNYLTEAMLGLNKINNDRFNNVENKIKFLAETTHKQFKIFEDRVAILLHNMKNLISVHMTPLLMHLYAQNQFSKIQDVVALHLDEYRYFDQIFIQLRKGIIPRDLISYKQLKEITKHIEDNLKGDFEIAFSDEDFVLFYNFPLIAHTLKEIEQNGTKSYELIMKLKIPLKRKGKQNQFSIYQPNSHAFPCLTDSCFMKSNSTENKLISFELPSSSWLINQVTGAIHHEADLDHFNCINTFEEKICLTFEPNLLRTPTSCSYSIHLWNQTGIVEYCSFKQRGVNDYRVIPISTHQYMFHKHIVNEFIETCKDRGTNTIKPTEWCTIYSIEKDCEIMIPATKQHLFGPFTVPINDSTYNEQFGYYSPLVEIITKKFTEINIEFNEDLLDNHFINKTLWNELKIELNNNQLSDLGKKAIIVTENLKQKIEKLNTKFTTYTYKSTFWGIFGLIADFISFTVTLMFIFGTLTYTRLFGFIGFGTFLITPKPIQAWEINVLPKIKFLPDINLDVLEDVAFITWILKIVLVMIFILLFFLLITTKWFRTVKFSYHYGKVQRYITDSQIELRRINQNYSILINIYNKTHFFKHIQVENVYIKMPIQSMPTEGIHSIQIKNRLVSWYICEINNNKCLCTTENIHLIGINSNGKRIKDKSENIIIDLNSIIWTSHPQPSCLKIMNNYDFAIVEVIKEPSREFARSVSGSTSTSQIEFV